MRHNPVNFNFYLEKLGEDSKETKMRVSPTDGQPPVVMSFKSDYSNPADLGVDLISNSPGKLKELLLSVTGHHYSGASKNAKQMMEMHLATRLAITAHNEVGKNYEREAKYSIDELTEIPYLKSGRVSTYGFILSKNGQEYTKGSFTYGLHEGEGKVSAKLPDEFKKLMSSYAEKNRSGISEYDLKMRVEKEFSKIEEVLTRGTKQHIANEKSREMALNHDNVMSFSR